MQQIEAFRAVETYLGHLLYEEDLLTTHSPLMVDVMKQILAFVAEDSGMGDQSDQQANYRKRGSLIIETGGMQKHKVPFGKPGSGSAKEEAAERARKRIYEEGKAAAATMAEVVRRESIAKNGGRKGSVSSGGGGVPQRRMSNIASMMAGDEDGIEGAHHEMRKDCNPHASTFAGREAELTSLVEMLKKSSFVTITGEPGVGKSTLALVGATTLQANMGSGAFYADLGGCYSMDDICRQIALAVGAYSDQHGLARLDYWMTENGTGKGVSNLLILDNCEDPCSLQSGLQDFSILLRQLLTTTATRLLVSSRAKIKLMSLADMTTTVHTFMDPLAQDSTEMLFALDSTDLNIHCLDQSQATSLMRRLAGSTHAKNREAMTTLSELSHGHPLALRLLAAVLIFQGQEDADAGGEGKDLVERMVEQLGELQDDEKADDGDEKAAAAAAAADEAATTTLVASVVQSAAVQAALLQEGLNETLSCVVASVIALAFNCLGEEVGCTIHI